MECTQKLEFTQEFNASQFERLHSEQIGFLGICGTKYAVKKGPNKIGRDPQTCDIVLNLNSISRQHAVINILNSSNFMIMDLDSANKTKLSGKTLQAYIPQPLKNGDMVQFGQVFGVFRLLEEENDLPMTQAVDIPETPVINRHASRVNNIPSTTIPESPDVSDRDDSFIKPSQANHDHLFKSPSNKFIKPSGKIVSIQPIGTNKIDNVFWNSSKKSKSLNLDLDDSSCSLDESILSVKTDNTLVNQDKTDDIHDMETQIPFTNNQNSVKTDNTLVNQVKTDDIHDMETQVPFTNNQNLVKTDNTLVNQVKTDDIHDMETQVPFTNNQNLVKTNNTLVNQDKSDDIRDMETQVPFTNIQNHNETADSIYTAETQVPVEVITSPSTRGIGTKLSEVCNIRNEEDSQLDCYFTTKEKDLSLYNAETQLPSDVQNKNDIDLDADLFEAETQIPIMNNKLCAPEESKKYFISPNIYDAETQVPTSRISNAVEDDDDFICTQSVTQDRKIKMETNLKNNINKSDKVIVFDEVDAQCFEENFDSQTLLPLSPSLNDGKENTQRKLIDDKKDINTNRPGKRSIRITSDSSTDCEDFNIVPNKKLSVKPLNDDLTDCEDEESNSEHKKITRDENVNTQDFLADDDFDNLPTQKLLANDLIEKDLMDCDENFGTKRNDLEIKEVAPDFEDQPTQVLTDKMPKPSTSSININNDPAFEDMLTQVLVQDKLEKDTEIEDLPTQVLDDNILTAVSDKLSSQQLFSEEIINPFKIPLPTPKKVKKKEIQKRIDSINIFKNKDEEDGKYYAATQEILQDLCSQSELSPELVKTENTGKNKTDTVNTCHISNLDKEVLITSVGIKQKGDKAVLIDEKSDNSDTDNADENVTHFVKNLTSKQIREVIGVSMLTSDHKIENLKRMSSDPSDVESTPKKVRPFQLMETDLPNSQEIKTSVSRKSLYTDSSSESEQEKDTQEENTPILFRPKRRNRKKDAVMDLTKAFEAKALPSRIITRVRKPTTKIQEADIITKKNNQKILKPKFLTEQEDNIDTEIVTENITRLKNKNEKKNKSETSDIIKENISKTSDVNLKKSEEIKSDPENSKKSKQKEKLNDKNLNKVNEAIKNENKEKVNDKKSHQTKSRQRSKRILCREEINDGNSEAVETVSEVREAKNASNNDILENSEKTSRNTRQGSRSKNNSKIEKISPERETNRRKIKVKVKLNDEENLLPKNEIRRSQRNKTKKSKTEIVNTDERPKSKTINENTEYKPKSILKNSKSLDNQSVVYNISSDSSADSSKNLKRSAMVDLDVPSPKRSRSCRGSNSSYLRSTPARGVQTQFVLFTAFPSEEVRLKLEALGAVVVTDVKDCTVVLTMQIKRTFKLLCAVGLGKPIVGPSWVQACVDNNVIVDPWLYLIKDEASEKRFQFSLERTLSGRRNFLKGYNVSCTPSVMPNEVEMKLIVECSGGTWKAQKPQWVCVSCLADKSQWDALRQKGAIIVSTEFILGGVLRQRADLKNNRLDVLK